MKPWTMVLLALLASSRFAGAGENLALAGSEVSDLGSYTYVGIITPFATRQPGKGFVLRNWLERLTYTYDIAGLDIDAERYGYAPALGYQTPLAGGYAAAYAGLRFAHTDLSPEDPANDEDGSTQRVFLQVDAGTPIGARAENQLVLSFETRYSDYYVRDRLMFRVGERRTVGPEVIFKGGRDYAGWQLGLAVGGMQISDNIGLLLRGGISAQDGESNAGYASLELIMDL